MQNKEAALIECRHKAVKEDKPFIVINTHGEGYEIVEGHFIIDRIYYHGEGGKKMFFTPIATCFPGGLVNYHNS